MLNKGNAYIAKGVGTTIINCNCKQQLLKEKKKEIEKNKEKLLKRTRKKRKKKKVEKKGKEHPNGVPSGFFEPMHKRKGQASLSRDKARRRVDSASTGAWPSHAGTRSHECFSSLISLCSLCWCGEASALSTKSQSLVL